MAHRLLHPLIHHHHHHHHHLITMNRDRCGRLISPQLIIHGCRSVAMYTTPPPSGDPGDWRFSPEWWGIHGHGWGRNEGSTLFSHASCKSNGIVSVTSHPASTSVCLYHSHAISYFDFHILIVCLKIHVFISFSFCDFVLFPHEPSCLIENVLLLLFFFFSRAWKIGRKYPKS